MQMEAAKTIYWGEASVVASNLILAATEEGLCYVQFHEGESNERGQTELFKWGQRHCPAYTWVKDGVALQPYVHQIEEYLKGLRTVFTLPLDLRGTEFQQGVWRVLNEIPHGQTHSYTQIAEGLDKSSAVRAVGTAIGANPVLIVVPCHRVIGKNGTLTGYRGGLANKERLLELERTGL
ncbi:methylated-DNA--[protein]-cysteine S-methyltransferase [Paenibacillus sp. HWE-109]|uniref:methylated-DNA--[protein]-cysteine S-methyltransferase n=1 Tax=Paenibacillus sp. HWE-109 TaxID=1306526 RepID=UPI001EDECE72|nr:methylated-DNA--[protein]-cysteine S-methyltransferase [Paenibacillus sp. HWE-109]UKS25326.1 methylated-DNA--[protein]-cysteine S-methyltransferase [Paenibacillus sp. HWE-109]